MFVSVCRRRPCASAGQQKAGVCFFWRRDALIISSFVGVSAEARAIRGHRHCFLLKLIVSLLLFNMFVHLLLAVFSCISAETLRDGAEGH